ncbi:CMP-N,N'-diacetyllegionaminic acid synthase [Seleniivibrio woodruffii]|uniref:CMP-N,N'-diacetyllegionaminic acid synthase n=2 Tax=Seleniivibrio woodruffii TaxID=1078050 RepID=A0A4R1KED4_9BACT|nr:CMP-N,N'-diacetyllegionaminic acid synthase [Seleniivibrio woodruffii]TVZ34530.1 CMP-N,N'-diacetyllegionaminic acid synthase [Seleniivibrio woodruffii]
MKILCTILARGGSKGVKNKNIKSILGKPLIHYTIEQAIASGLFTHIVVNSDSEEILNVASEINGIDTVIRPSELATDTSAKLPAIIYTVNEMENRHNTVYDIVVDLDCTSPLRDVEDIKNAFDSFASNGNLNLITAMPARRSPYFNMVKLDENGSAVLVNRTDSHVVRRQDAPECFDMNASIYIWKRDVLLNSTTLFLGNTGLYVMPEERSIDIDTHLDFEFVEFLLRKKNA